MKTLICMSLVYLTSCNSDFTYNDKRVLSSDSIRQFEGARVNAKENRENYKTSIDKKEIIGIWASNDNEPVTIKISTDSIYYTEHFQSYKYELKDDSIFINYPDLIFSAKIFFDKDSLVLESEDGKSKYYRFIN